jgi:hypothetical protein
MAPLQAKYLLNAGWLENFSEQARQFIMPGLLALVG